MVRTVSWKARRERRPGEGADRTASTRLTTGPSAAASVGVTMPKYMEPSTTTMRSATGATSPSDSSFSREGPRSSAARGAASGQSIA